MMDILTSLLEWLYVNPHWAIVITFGFVLIETLAVIGILIPGGIFLTLMGALIGAGLLPLYPIVLAAILGAVVGDLLSYFLGYYFHQNIRTHWPLSRYPNALLKGEKFFQKHGGKSVFLARFVGPVRPIAPLIAGMLVMPLRQYLIANVSAAIIWAPLFLAPGILFGVASTELAPTAALRLFLILFSVLLAGWLIIQLLKFSLNRTSRSLSHLADQVWRSIHHSPKLHWIRFIIYDPHYPKSHRQLFLLFISLLMLLSFILITLNVQQFGMATWLNNPTHHFMRAIRLEWLDNIMVVITLLGDKRLIPILAFGIVSWLIYHRYWLTAIHLLAATFIAYAAGYLLKLWIVSPRPFGSILTGQLDSFPSGHSLLAMAFFGVLAVLIARQANHTEKQRIYSITFTVVLIIALSRLYLGAHWLSDVVASIFLGLFIVMITLLAHRRLMLPKIPLKPLLTFSLSWLLIIWAGFAYQYNDANRQRYQLIWPNCITTFSDWWDMSDNESSLYRNTLIGTRGNLFNLQWVGDIEHINTQLAKQGWQQQRPEFNWEHTFKRLAAPSQSYQLPIMPRLHHDQIPILVMTLPQDNNSPPLELRLWPSHIVFNDNNLSLWLGTLDYQQRNYLFTRLRRDRDTTPNSEDIITELIPYLRGFGWQLKTVVDMNNQSQTEVLFVR